MPSPLVTHDVLTLAVDLDEWFSLPMTREETRTALSYWISPGPRDARITEFVTADTISDYAALMSEVGSLLARVPATDSAYREIAAASRWLTRNRDAILGIVRGDPNGCDDRCPGCECEDDMSSWGGPCAHCRMH